MSNFTPTQAELALVSQVFAVADPQGLGIVQGDAAVKAFSGSNLSPSILGDIWSIADKENNGFLTRKGVAMALRLIAHVQSGEELSEDLLTQSGPIPRIAGITRGGVPTSPPRSPPIRSSQPQTPALPTLTPQDKTKFIRMFVNCGPENGLLSGDKAREVFVKSQLPYEKLSKIWSLSDTQDRGSLDQTDFIIAMYLIQATISGQLSVLPQSLPPSIYAQASGRPMQTVATHGTGASGSVSPSHLGSFPGAAIHTGSPLVPQGTGSATIPRQTTGQASIMQQPPITRAAVTANMTGSTLGSMAFGGAKPWDISNAEKAKYDQFFDGLDSQKQGHIEGDIAVPFMLQSKLSEDVLAQVWDLADLNNDGRLTRDGFAVAMHLINDKLAGRDIPTRLPDTLIPPSMRGYTNTAGVLTNVPTSIPESMQDLLWDDTPPASATNAHFSPQVAPVHITQSVQQLPTTRQQQQYSSGGRTSILSPGSAFTSPPIAHSTGQQDLLSDDDSTAVASTVPDNSAEIGNLRIQLDSTTRSLETTRNERVLIEKNLEAQATQVVTLQTQLSSAKASYETETRLLSTLRERFASQASGIQKTREDLIRAESDLSAVRVEKSEVEGGLLRDKEDLRELRRKMDEISDTIDKTKVEIEKMKKEAKQQKGLLAIARKQLLAREADKMKVEKELEEVTQELNDITADYKGVETQLQFLAPPANGVAIDNQRAPSRADSLTFAAAFPLPSSPSPPSSTLSPTSGSGKSNNPFEKLVQSAATSSQLASPFQNLQDSFVLPAQAEVPQLSVTPQPLAATEALTRTTEDELDGPLNVFEQDLEDKSPFETNLDTNNAFGTPTKPLAGEDPFGFPDVAEAPPAVSRDSSEESHVVQPVQDLAKSPAEDAWPVLQVNGSTSVISASTNKGVISDAMGVLDKGPEIPAPDSQTELEVANGATNDHNVSTDLNEKLKEIEHDDSDSDDDSDNEPLSHLTKGKGHGVVTTEIANTKQTDAPTSSGPSNSDDLFGSSNLEMLPTEERVPSPGVPVVPVVLPTVDKDLNNQAKSEISASGISAFDEALGKMSTPTVQSEPQFSGFDDNFDFAEAKAVAATSGTSSQAPVPTSFPEPQPQLSTLGLGANTTESPFVPKDITNSITPSKADANSNSPFPVVSFPQPSPVAAPPTPTQNNNPFSSLTTERKVDAGDHGITFGEVFGGNGNASTALSLGGNIQSKETDPPKPLNVTSPPGSPPGPSIVSANSSSSPPPLPPTLPPRSGSPKPRPSTGSSSDGHGLNKGHPPQKHSKLSIRLPFGRKKKKTDQDTSTAAQGNLSSVAEPIGSTTPVGDEDVEPVKQLCGMGFSRSQAISALEQNGYDVQRALNQLLGAA